MSAIKYVYNFILNGWSFVHKKEKCLGYPPIIAIEPTNHCPMKCIMCPRQYMKRSLGFMDFNLFKKIIDQTKGCTNLISLELFGDSLLHPKIEQMFNYLNKKGIISQISTNATSLSDKAIDKILTSGLDILLIALDGIDDKTYKKYRGKYADYKKAVIQVNNLLKRKIEEKRKKPFINMRMLGLPGLQEHFDVFKKQWKKPGIDQISTNTFHTFGGSVKEIDVSKIKSSKWVYHGVCYKPWEGLHVMWDGRVVPCCFDYDGRCILGDLNKESLEEVWNGEKMRELRKQFLTKNLKSNPLCVSCNERKHVKVSKFFPLDIFFLKNIIYYLYQRNQNKIVIKKIKKVWDRIR